jgi:dTDP-4-amino-4,6-dideoxygalactose transaminase
MLSIPLLDLRRGFAEIEEEVLSGFKEVFVTQKVLNGKNLLSFEEEFARYIGTKYALGCASGTDALLMALLACGVGKGDEVLLQANAFIADFEAIHWVGAEPVFVEVDSKTFGPDLFDLQKKITPRTKALLLVHMYGDPADMDEILEICDRFGITLIEDASHAHGAEYKGRKVGSFGRVACFSCGPVKNLNALGDAGVLTTNDDEIASKIKYLRVHGQVEKNHSHFPGFNSRLDELQAIILRAKLKTLDAKNEKRREIANRYREGLSDIPELFVHPAPPPYKKSVYHRFVIGTEKRDELVKYLKEKGIGTGYYYPIPLHKQKAYLEAYGKAWHLPQAEKLARELVAIPMYPELTDEEIDYIIQAIRTFFSKG